MKKLFFSGCLLVLSSIIACNDDTKRDTHTHDDGTTHAAHDTVMPVQEQFQVTDTAAKDATGKDTTGQPHTHKEGEKHAH